MRAFGSVLAAVVAAAALATEPPSIERLDPYSVLPARRGGTVLAAFSAPTDAAARDLRTAALAVRVGDDPTATFGVRTAGLRIHPSGLRARYVAPKRSGGRITKFKLSTVSGAFGVSLRGERLDSRHPPFVELDLAGHVYRWDPALPDGPPPTVVPLPSGTVTFNTCTRNVVSIASTVGSTVIHSQAELGKFLAAVTPYAGDVAVLEQNDFSRNMIVVAVGVNTAQGVLPFAVSITGVESDGHTLTVSFDQMEPSWTPSAPATGGAPSAAFCHAVAVPTSGMPVRFTATAVAAVNPWN